MVTDRMKLAATGLMGTLVVLGGIGVLLANPALVAGTAARYAGADIRTAYATTSAPTDFDVRHVQLSSQEDPADAPALAIGDRIMIRGVNASRELEVVDLQSTQVHLDGGESNAFFLVSARDLGDASAGLVRFMFDAETAGAMLQKVQEKEAPRAL